MEFTEDPYTEGRVALDQQDLKVSWLHEKNRLKYKLID